MGINCLYVVMVDKTAAAIRMITGCDSVSGGKFVGLIIDDRRATIRHRVWLCVKQRHVLPWAVSQTVL